MTYTVDVSGIFTIIKEPPEILKQDWEDFQIEVMNDKEVSMELHGRTPWYQDVEAKLYVLGLFYEGMFEGEGEDGKYYSITLPMTKDEIINTSERLEWGKETDHKNKEIDTLYDNLKDIKMTQYYPEWLKDVPKINLREKIRKNVKF